MNRGPGALMMMHGTDRITWPAAFVDPHLVGDWPEEVGTMDPRFGAYLDE